MDYLEALSQRARELGREGSTDQEVIEVNTEILRIDANRDDAYTRRGSCYQKHGRLDKAVEDLRRAVDLNPNNSLAQSRLRQALESRAQIEALRETQRSQETRAYIAPHLPVTSLLRQESYYDDSGWREETPLHKLGYRITKRTRHQRWQVLVSRAVPQLGLFEVSHTIANNCRLRRLQYDREIRYAHAIGEWEHDLARLKEVFYEGSFPWPSTEID